MAVENIITFKHVTFTYQETDSPAINNISFNIQKNSWTTLIGHNGSGKSTVTKLINGLLTPDKNGQTKIIVDNKELNNKNVWDIRNEVGIVFQNPDNQFVGATVADDVAFGLENRGVPREKMIEIVDSVIKQVGMEDYINSEPASLSGGQKQRVAIAGILAIKPKIIILDEATSMLDPLGRNSVIKLVKKMKEQNNLTVISITHDINEAALADEILVLDDGKLVAQGTLNKIFDNAKLINEIGLEKPLVFQLKDKLIKAGIKIPADVDSQEKLINSLCQLNSNM